MLCPAPAARCRPAEVCVCSDRRLGAALVPSRRGVCLPSSSRRGWRRPADVCHNTCPSAAPCRPAEVCQYMSQRGPGAVPPRCVCVQIVVSARPGAVPPRCVIIMSQRGPGAVPPRCVVCPYRRLGAAWCVRQCGMSVSSSRRGPGAVPPRCVVCPYRRLGAALVPSAEVCHMSRAASVCVCRSWRHAPLSKESPSWTYGMLGTGIGLRPGIISPLLATCTPTTHPLVSMTGAPELPGSVVTEWRKAGFPSAAQSARIAP